jgi:uncharacterized protein
MPTIDQARLWYPADDPVHGFDHVLRVYTLAEYLAISEGADLKIVRAAALLHDASIDILPPYSGEIGRMNHQHLSAELAQEVLAAEGWSSKDIAAVQHAIRAHRFRENTEPPRTLEAQVVFDADKLDAIGAIGAARAIAYAVRRGEPAYASPSESFLNSGRLEAEERHSAYHEYRYKLIHLKDRLHTETARRLAQERHQQMVDFFEALARQAGGLPG